MPTTTSPAYSWRETLRCLHWLFNPFQQMDAVQIYNLLSTRWRTERTLYLNLGYWEKAENLEQACEALAALVATTAKMGPQDQVLDVGFGFADQDIFWAQSYRPRSIIGLNITASQVEVARKRVKEFQLTECIDLQVGSATQMPLGAESVDVVVAVECAFHFRTRQEFFQEAFRVLRPGGRLAVADILPMPAASGILDRLVQRLLWRIVAGKFAVPKSNGYDLYEYARRLQSCGFAGVRVNSIREKVYEPLHRYLAQHPGPIESINPALRTSLRWALRLEPAGIYRGFDYVLVSAVKP